MGKIADGYSDQVAVGTVLARRRNRARLKKGTAINLVVCAGPKPVSITDYQGTPYDAAATALKGAGFQVVERSGHSSKVGKDEPRAASGSATGHAARGEPSSLLIAGTTAGHRA